MKTLQLSILVASIFIFGLVSCKKDNSEPTAATPISNTITDTVPFSRAGSFVFINFKDGKKVASADSASAKWDIGIRYVDILVNSHSSGPGNGGVITQMVDTKNKVSFDLLKVAPENGYAYDTSATQRAINTDLMAGWYNYDRNTHAFSSKADRFFIIRTADGHYVKMEILEVDYADFNGPTPITLYYKIRYTYQPDGSRNF